MPMTFRDAMVICVCCGIGFHPDKVAVGYNVYHWDRTWSSTNPNWATTYICYPYYEDDWKEIGTTELPASTVRIPVDLLSDLIHRFERFGYPCIGVGIQSLYNQLPRVLVAQTHKVYFRRRSLDQTMMKTLVREMDESFVEIEDVRFN